MLGQIVGGGDPAQVAGDVAKPLAGSRLGVQRLGAKRQSAASLIDLNLPRRSYFALSNGTTAPAALSTDLATPGPLFSSVEVGTEWLIFTALGSYRVLKNEAAHIDAHAGLRVWSVDVDLDFAAVSLPAESFPDGDS